MYPIKQSTAITVPFYVHDASGDAVTGLSDGSFTKRISKGGGAFGAMTVTITEMENGWYSIPLSASHSDTLELLSITFTNAGAKQVNLQFRVHVRIPDDLAFPTTTGRSMDVEATGEVGINLDNTTGTLAAAQIATNAITADKIAADAIGASELAADAVTEIRDAVTGGAYALDTDANGAIRIVDGTGAREINTNGGAVALVDLVTTTTNNSDMRGTDNAALASVLGALTDAAAAGDPTTADTVMQYAKQVVNVLVGTDGVATWPAAKTPANAVNFAEVLRGLKEQGSYADGAVWIDTVNGAAGTDDYENGTELNPSSNLADAVVIAASLGRKKFIVLPGGSITFGATDHSNETWEGDGWTLVLGTVTNAAGIIVKGATISGVMAGTGTTQIFEHCLVGAMSLIKGTHLLTCGIGGTQTVIEAGDYFFDRCHSAIAGTATWVFDFGAAIGNTNLNLRNYSGGVQLEAMGDTGTDTASIEGQGQIIENACTGGTVAVRGNFTVSGITNLTLSDDARIDTGQINAEVDTALNTAIPGGATADSINERIAALNDDWDNGGRLDLLLDAVKVVTDTQARASATIADGTASGTPTTTAMISDIGVTVDDQFKGRIITFAADTTTAALRKQSTDITACTAASNTLTFTALTTAPVSGDTFSIT